MIHDLQLGQPSPDLRAEVVIVGAGAAGIALALELARFGKQVLLLEGGGLDPEDASQELCRGENTGLPHRGLSGGRYRVHGGTTTQWGGQILELEEDDFEPHPWIAGSGWPFRKAELVPFYERALALEGLSGAMEEDADVWRALGEVPPHLPNLSLYLSRWCPEPNFARLHRQALASDPRIGVWLHSNAVELIMDNGHATGIRCRSLAGHQATFRAERYVFCLGAIESARFFLQQQPGSSLPWNQSGLLGRHFQDHIDADVATLQPRSPEAFHSVFDSIFLRGFKYNPKLRLCREGQRSEELLIAGGTVFSASSSDTALADVKSTAKNLLHGRFGAIRGNDLIHLLRHAPLAARQTFRYAVQHRGFHPEGAEIRLRVHCEQEPLSASTIRLSDETDALGLRRAQLDWRISPRELRTIRCFVECAKSALAPLAEVTPDPALLASDTAFLRNCQDGYHHMGGMRMDASPAAGVVDPHLRLHNTENVFACTTGVFPSSGFSNPTHTLLALSARLASHLSA